MTEEKTTSKKPNIMKFFMEIITYFTVVSILGFFILTLFINKLSIAPHNIGSSFQQLVDLTENVGNLVIDTSFQIEIFVCILISIAIISAIWSLFKFNRLEKRIAEIQEKLNKE